MIDGQWEDWIEPLEILLAKTKEFLDTVKQISSRIHELPKGEKRVESSVHLIRIKEFGKALAAFLSEPKEIWTTDFLKDYIDVSSIYEDAFSLVFEYIGEHEHEVDLHGEEFAQTEANLLKGFAQYVGCWE